MAIRPAKHIVDLTERMLCGELTDEQLAELERRLATDKAAQQFVLDYCQFHAMLSFDLRAQQVIERVIASRGLHRQADRPNADPAAKWTGRVVPTWKSLRRVATHTLAVAATVAVVVMGSLALLRPSVDMGPIASEENIGQAVLPEVTTVNIDNQTTRIALSEIGSVTLQGPSDFELIGPRRARLTKGRIKFRVTDIRGRGFVVETPDGEITDLGTEFGLDVGSDAGTGLVVFEGEVDLRLPGELADVASDATQPRRLVGGEGVFFSRSGRVDRIMSIFTKDNVTFTCRYEPSGDERPIIIDVRDNLRTSDTLQFYEIVPAGMREDARAYVDRPAHQWNGADQSGIPEYLIGADYVKPFNNDKMRTNFELQVTLAVPADVYLFFDDRIDPPDWLLADFEDTGKDIGIDMGPWRTSRRTMRISSGAGAGKSVDNVVSIWRRKQAAEGTIALGANQGTSFSAMYGICAVASEPESSP